MFLNSWPSIQVCSAGTWLVVYMAVWGRRCFQRPGSQSLHFCMLVSASKSHLASPKLLALPQSHDLCKIGLSAWHVLPGPIRGYSVYFSAYSTSLIGTLFLSSSRDHCVLHCHIQWCHPDIINPSHPQLCLQPYHGPAPEQTPCKFSR